MCFIVVSMTVSFFFVSGQTNTVKIKLTFETFRTSSKVHSFKNCLNSHVISLLHFSSRNVATELGHSWRVHSHRLSATPDTGTASGNHTQPVPKAKLWLYSSSLHSKYSVLLSGITANQAPYLMTIINI